MSRIGTREAYGPDRIPGLEVSYPQDVRGKLLSELRGLRRQAETRALRLIWADERAAQRLGVVMGRSAGRPNGEERGTRGIILEKDEGKGIIVGWVDASYRTTRTEVTRDRLLYERRRKIPGGVRFAQVTIGRAHTERQTGDDLVVSVPGLGRLMFVTPEEVLSTAGKEVAGALSTARLTDVKYTNARQTLDRLRVALDCIGDAMGEPGLNPQIAEYLQ